MDDLQSLKKRVEVLERELEKKEKLIRELQRVCEVSCTLLFNPFQPDRKCLLLGLNKSV